MLKIRQEQNKILSEYMLRQYVDRVAVKLRSEYAKETNPLNDEGLKTLIKDGIKRAGKYHIEYEDDIQEYIEYMVMYGVDFEKNPKFTWLRNILENSDLVGSKKMDEINKQHAFLSMKTE